MSNFPTILVVDDEDILRKALVFQFKRAGYEVFAASNGVEAYEIIKTQKIDAVVSDIQMPGGNGIELLKNIRSKDEEIPVVVFISAYADLSDEEAFDLGANAVFSKPFDRHALLSTITKSIQYQGKIWKEEVDQDALRESQTIDGKSVTIGRRGMFLPISGEEFPEIGTEIPFSVRQYNNLEVKLEGIGVVRWTRKYQADLPSGIGVEFKSMTKDSSIAFEDLINKGQVKFYIPRW